MSGIPDLAVVLFLPWFLVLGALFSLLPREPRGLKRRGFDLVVLVLAVLASAVAARWSFAGADTSHGTMWPQVLAAVVAYAAFIVVLAVAWPLRHLLLRKKPM